MGSRQSRWALAALVLFQVLTTSGVAADSRSRPFTVVIDGNANPVFDGCTVVNTETGTGHATHMGTIVWQSTEIVDACSDPDFAQVDGQFVLTDKRGAQIMGTYRTVARLDFATNEVTAAGLYRITGGTGRFANASGQGVIVAQGSLLPPFDVAGRFSGQIAF